MQELKEREREERERERGRERERERTMDSSVSRTDLGGSFPTRSLEVLGRSQGSSLEVLGGARGAFWGPRGAWVALIEPLGGL